MVAFVPGYRFAHPGYEVLLDESAVPFALSETDDGEATFSLFGSAQAFNVEALP
jgi:hypothetical protein